VLPQITTSQEKKPADQGTTSINKKFENQEKEQIIRENVE
jgi:hypothetical protein